VKTSQPVATLCATVTKRGSSITIVRRSHSRRGTLVVQDRNGVAVATRSLPCPSAAVIVGCVSTGSEIVVSRVLILIRASLIAVTPRLIVIRPRLILITRRVVGIIHGAIPHQMKRTGEEFAPHRRLTISRPSSSAALPPSESSLGQTS